MGFFFVIVEMMHHVHGILLFGNDVTSLKSKPLIFMYLYTHIQSIQKQTVEYNIKSKYTEEYLTVKEGCEKLLARKFSFM